MANNHSSSTVHVSETHATVEGLSGTARKESLPQILGLLGVFRVELGLIRVELGVIVCKLRDPGNNRTASVWKSFGISWLVVYEDALLVKNKNHVVLKKKSINKSVA